MESRINKKDIQPMMAEIINELIDKMIEMKSYKD